MSFNLSILILAGGTAQRFGKNKLAARLPNGQTLLERTVSQCVSLSQAPVVVVSGAYPAGLPAAWQNQVHEVANPAWKEGISSSIRAGLQAIEQLQPGCSHVLICLADLPKITGAGLQQLIEVAQIKPQMQIASFWAERCSAPAIFPRAYWPALYELTGDRGAGRLLQSGLYSEPVVTLPVPHIEAAWDIDTPDALNDL